MKILITGAAGMLAAEVVKELKKNNNKVIQTDINQRLPDISKLDVADQKATYNQIKDVLPDYVFHLAAETDVDLCQKEPRHAFKVNDIGTENIVLACQEFDIPLLYISTSSVFPGDKMSPYTELDTPNPVNIYAESKFQGELKVKGLLKKYFIIRAGWMIGGWEIDKKFVYKIFQQLKEGKREVRVVNDRFGSPTFTKDFAKNFMSVINTKQYGLFHLVNKGTCSRYDIAVKIVEFMGLKDRVKIEPIDSSQYPLPAPRPRSEMLANYKLDLMGFNNMPYWEESLAEYISLNRDR